MIDFLDDSLLVNGQMLEVQGDDYVPEKPIKDGKRLSKKKVHDNAEDPALNGKKNNGSPKQTGFSKGSGAARPRFC